MRIARALIHVARAHIGAQAIVVAAALAAAPIEAASASREPSGAAASEAAVGPVARVAEPGAAVARSFDDLAAMVADASGPRAIELAPGVYRGDLVVKRAVAIRGAKGAVLAGTGHGTVVAIDADDVTIENVVVRDSGRRHTTEDAGIKARGERVRVADVRVEETLFGVSLHECRRCVLERVHVQGWGDDTELRGDGVKLWESNDSVVRGSVIDRSRDVVVWYTRRAVLEDNVVTGGRYGTHFMYAHDCVVRRSRFERDVVGVFVMYSMRLRVEENVLAGARGAAGVGLGFKDSDAVHATRNWIVANTTGIYLDNTPRTPSETVEIGENLFALNDVGLRLHSPEKGLVVRGNDLHQNATLVEADGGGDALSADVRNNRFSDYEGYDLDGDGKGDVAYEVKALSSELADARPAVKLFSGTAAMGLVDAVARAVPVLSTKRLLVDPAPLAERPNLPQPRTP